MTTITECLECPSVTGTSAVLSRVYPPVVDDIATSADIVITVIAALFVSSASASESITDKQFSLLEDAASGSESLLSLVTARDLIEDSARGVATTLSRISDLIADTAEGAETPMQSMIRSLLTDTATAAAAILPGLRVNQFVESAATATSEILRTFFERLVVDTATGTATILPGARLVDLIADIAAGSVVVLDKRTTFDLLSAVATGLAEAFGTATARDLVEDTAIAEASPLDALGTVAWTAPLDAFAMSRYTLPELNSLAANGAALLLFGPDGAFLRAGITDDGAPIDASVKTGLTDFDTDALKRADTIYLGYRSSKPVGLRIGETRLGTERTFSYQMPARTVEITASSAAVVKPGRGLESRYYRYTIHNTDGGSLSLRRLTITYLPTGRNY